MTYDFKVDKTYEKVDILSFLYAHVTITSVKRFSYSKSTSFTKMRWLQDVTARTLRSGGIFLRQSRRFFFPSYCLSEAKIARHHQRSHEVETKITRFDIYALTIALQWAKKTYEFNTKTTFGWSFGNVLACQRLCHRSQSCCWRLKFIHHSYGS